MIMYDCICISLYLTVSYRLHIAVAVRYSARLPKLCASLASITKCIKPNGQLTPISNFTVSFDNRPLVSMAGYNMTVIGYAAGFVCITDMSFIGYTAGFV